MIDAAKFEFFNFVFLLFIKKLGVIVILRKDEFPLVNYLDTCLLLSSLLVFDLMAIH